MNEPQSSASVDASAMTALLTVRGLTIRFGGLVAIQALDLEVRQGEIFALVGPNGAGKTTLLNCVSGFVRPAEGTITFGKTPLLRLGRHQRAALGIARTFQNVQLFASMTVLDNLLTAQHAHLHTNVFTGLLPFGPAIREDAAARERAHAMLTYLDLDTYAHTVAGTLPSGLQKLVGVARALVLRPRLLLLDEPAAGIPHSEVTHLAASMRRWRDDLGTSVLLIEHNIPLVQSVADRICVLDYGRKLVEGLPKAVLADPQVLEAYLGRDGARSGGAGAAGTTGAEEVSHVAG